MQHPVHKKIRKFIAENSKTRDEIALALNMTTRTLIRRISEGNWTLPELVVLEELFGTTLLAIGEKYVIENKHVEVNELSHTYSPPASYKINIEIDPRSFNPEDFDRLQKELVERMLLNFDKEKNNTEE